MVLSIDPDAIRFPVGSNLAAKISPECPESSITGAWRSLVRGAYFTDQHLGATACETTMTYLHECAALARACESATGANILALHDKLALARVA